MSPETGGIGPALRRWGSRGLLAAVLVHHLVWGHPAAPSPVGQPGGGGVPTATPATRPAPRASEPPRFAPHEPGPEAAQLESTTEPGSEEGVLGWTSEPGVEATLPRSTTEPVPPPLAPLPRPAGPAWPPGPDVAALRALALPRGIPFVIETMELRTRIRAIYLGRFVLDATGLHAWLPAPGSTLVNNGWASLAVASLRLALAEPAPQGWRIVAQGRPLAMPIQLPEMHDARPLPATSLHLEGVTAVDLAGRWPVIVHEVLAEGPRPDQPWRIPVYAHGDRTTFDGLLDDPAAEASGASARPTRVGEAQVYALLRRRAMSLAWAREGQEGEPDGLAALDFTVTEGLDVSFVPHPHGWGATLRHAALGPGTGCSVFNAYPAGEPPPLLANPRRPLEPSCTDGPGR